LNPEHTIARLIRAGVSAPESRAPESPAPESAAKARRFAAGAQRLIDAGHADCTEAIAIFVPGRIEVLGKHTDYCGGRSLVCTVDRGMCFVGVRTSAPGVQFHAIDASESATLSAPQTSGHWSNYPATVVKRIERNFPDVPLACAVAMTSDLPPASGLSSSSAMVIGTFLTIAGLHGIDQTDAYRRHIHSNEDLAAYLACHENGQSFGALAGDKGVGTFGGSQDHTAILCCKPGRLSVYSFCPVLHERDVSLPDELCFVIVGSGVLAEKTGDALEKYNAVSLRARRIVERWNATRSPQAAVLREVGEIDLDHSLATRRTQFLAESTRIIPAAADAIEKGDWASLGSLVDDSQYLAERCLLNQIPETIELQQRLRHSGAIAASAFGAGFGGSVWGLFDRASAEQFVSQTPGAFITRPSCPAFRL